jgi:uncharacterized protein YigE (DUF2233 family)
MAKLWTWIICLMAAGSSAGQTSPRIPASVQSLLTALRRSPAEHRTIRVNGYVYQLNSMLVTDPDDSRYGLSVVWMDVPESAYDVSVVDSRKYGTISSTFEAVPHLATDVLLINGGYFGQGNDSNYIPLGLVKTGGRVVSNLRHWTSGGVALLGGPHGPLTIVPIGNLQQYPNPFEAIQSKPLLVEDLRTGIRSDDHQRANRTAVGICVDGSILFVGAFADGGAISLYEFASLITSDTFGPSPVSSALNMDGGPSSHIYLPGLHLHFGADTTTFIPNMIRLSSKPH